MFSVDIIDEEKVTLINNDTGEKVVVDYNMLPKDIKEGDIIKKVNDIYVIDKEKTERVKRDIRNRFNILLNDK